MKRRTQFVSVVLCGLLLSLGTVSGAGVVGSAEATARTAMLGPGPERDSSPNTFRDPSPDLLERPGHGAGEGNFPVPNVHYQFLTLQVHGDPIAFRLGVGDEPTIYDHYQGMARVNGPDGTPYIILTRSWEPRPGELLVVRMTTRDKDGERLRSNLLNPDQWMGITSPWYWDRGVWHIHFDGQDGWPCYEHPAGVQAVGDVLVVALGFPCGGGIQGLALIDVSNPERPSLLRWWEVDSGLGFVGATYIGPDEHPTYGDRYLFVMEDGVGFLRFAWSNSDDLKQTTDLVVEPFTWEKANLGPDEDRWRGWQMLNCVRDEITGALYLVGADKKTYPHSEENYLGLFTMNVSLLTSENVQGAISFVAQRLLDLTDPPMGSLDAASGTYVSPSGQLIVYTAPHDGEGGSEGAVRMGEFRNRDVYYPGTTAYDTMCPWVELYRHVEGWQNAYEILPGDGRSLMLDFQDRYLESWRDLDDENFGDQVSSLRWYLAPGQILELFQNPGYGPPIAQIVGTGGVGWIDDLNIGSFGDNIDSVLIYPFADPGGPYQGDEGSWIPLSGANPCYAEEEVIADWDVDSGVCTLSDPAARQPSLICGDDGSSTITLTITDSNFHLPNYATSTYATATVENVAPVVSIDSITAEPGAEVGSGLRVALVGLTVSVTGSFTDPGWLDTHTASMDWGDGTVDDIGAVQETISATHAYAEPGVYAVSLTVTDDDGGVGTATAQVEPMYTVYLPLILRDSGATQ